MSEAAKTFTLSEGRVHTRNYTPKKFPPLRLQHPVRTSVWTPPEPPTDPNDIEAMRKRYPHRVPELIGIPPIYESIPIGGRYWRWDVVYYPTRACYVRPGTSRIFAYGPACYPGGPQELSDAEHAKYQDRADQSYDEFRIENGLPL